MSSRVLSLLAVVLACSACSSQRAHAGLRTATRQMNLVGWFEVTPSPLPARPAPPATAGLDEDEREDVEEDYEDALEDYESDLEDAYQDQFVRLPLSRQTPACSRLSRLRDTGRPLYVFVHGIGVDRHEWHPVFEALHRERVSGAVMYRWLPYEQSEYLLEELAAGLSRVTRCVDDVVVMAHSAGGVLVSFALARVDVPASSRLRIVTVASPLAGTGYDTDELDRTAESRFVLELGKKLKGGYPAAPARTDVVHARTQYPADRVMKPNARGHAPNERGVGVSGAREVDLPAHLDHVKALEYVIEKLLAGLPPG